MAFIIIDGTLMKYIEDGNHAVVVPDHVKHINEGAFYRCNRISSVTIPRTVESIGERIFDCCQNLSNVTILNPHLKVTGIVFEYCNSMKTICIPKNPDFIEEYLLVNAQYLVVDYSPITARYYDDFYDVEESYHPAKIQYIEDVEETYLYYNEFDDGIPSHVVIDGVLTRIPHHKKAKGISNIVLPDCVTEIGKDAFFGYENLESIEIPNTVTVIHEYAFANCSSIKKLILKNCTLGERAFFNCTSLAQIQLYGNVCYASRESVFENCAFMKK